MTFHMAPEQGDTRPSLVEGLLARCAVGAARLLAQAPPERIRVVLERALRGTRPASYSEAKAARDAVLAVSLRCAGPKACLPRSLAVTLLCRMRGTRVSWCVGVLRRPPFMAHAWVEAEGRMVGEGRGERGDSEHFSKLITVG
ncbi:lasso peptide biosynthesis B2 protein [Marinactinospora thermotolerans]|uniref:Transglutaminase-like superfamily protein n=1 Tax=Marinactinospora thermotolerans DSM 45154 TaxID=1122192 RepID=A0A1T4S659_9ACTN|nr:lasso peptide biosynthesis B2 protein [Marinactinospora thermotolerans]SKA23739.1 Transglutaminase-like superfamily protein [Marinactinospora thermotolerans DSM 45154]